MTKPVLSAKMLLRSREMRRDLTEAKEKLGGGKGKVVSALD
ncbi:MAG: hypothetical protein AB1656_03140 [Candidatus Omnitrophota bacterium]